MQAVVPNDKVRLPIMFCLIFFVLFCAVGCMESSLRADFHEGRGQLNLAFTLPSDVHHIDVQLYSQGDASNTLVDETTLATGNLSVLFTGLKAGDYTVEAQGFSSVGSETYSGQGDVFVYPDVLNNLTILWMANQDTASQNNASPKIEYVDVDGNFVPATDLDAGADPGLYVIAPGPGEQVLFTVATSDADGDSLSVAWTVKDGPDPEDNNAGMVCGTGDTVSWFHDLPGVYFVKVHVSDGLGGSVSFMFEVYVLSD